MDLNKQLDAYVAWLERHPEATAYAWANGSDRTMAATVRRRLRPFAIARRYRELDVVTHMAVITDAL